MHGQIGDRNSRIATRGDLDFYYRTRAALLDSYRRAGDGGIDYDFYRARACEERNRVRRETFKWLRRFIRPLVAVVAIAAAIWIMPTWAKGCGICGAHDTQIVRAHEIRALQ